MLEQPKSIDQSLYFRIFQNNIGGSNSDQFQYAAITKNKRGKDHLATQPLTTLTTFKKR